MYNCCMTNPVERSPVVEVFVGIHAVEGGLNIEGYQVLAAISTSPPLTEVLEGRAVELLAALTPAGTVINRVGINSEEQPTQFDLYGVPVHPTGVARRASDLADSLRAVGITAITNREIQPLSATVLKYWLAPH
ncbi:MAG: hypothetical protein ACI9T8_000490 [Candidatus Saccharimonadales bacterium]|jgi:hypothetical protein